MEPEELAALMLALQVRGYHKINFVTPEHVVPEIVEALVVDIYMPDFKY